MLPETVIPGIPTHAWEMPSHHMLLCSPLGTAAPCWAHQVQDRDLSAPRLKDSLWQNEGWDPTPTLCWDLLEWTNLAMLVPLSSIHMKLYKIGCWGFTWSLFFSWVSDWEWKEVSASAWVVSSASQIIDCFGVMFILLRWLSLESSFPEANKLLSGPLYWFAWDIWTEFSEMQ